MNTKYARLGLTGLLVCLLAFFAGGVHQASAASVTPIFVAGNPTCVDLGYDFGFKVDPPNAGTYNIGGFNTVTVTTDGVYFDWSSTLGMDAVIAKGGPNANVYTYDPPAESFGDTGLHSPINPNNGQPFGLSHIEFCFDYELSISKTANPTFTRTFNWTIDKSVTPDTLNMFTGDSGTVQYTVAVVKTRYTDSDWAVNGTITIQNNTPLAATISGVSDQISGDGSPTPNCGVTFPYTLPSGGTLTCSYNSSLPDGSNRTNTAAVTTSGMVDGGTATAAIAFGSPTTVVNGTINVDDTNGVSWVFNDSGSVSYTRTFTCDADEGSHNNTATIRETGQSDSASVTVNCYALTVTKNASTSLTRTWNWTIDKSADADTLLLSDGQLYQVNYQVTVNTISTDSNHAVSGTISVNNPAPIDATLNGVSDVVSSNIAANVDCGVTFPYTLPAGGTLNCSYSASLPDSTDRTNTATATLQNTPGGTTDFSGSASVSFANATVTQVDECIDVSDTNIGVLGTVCADSAPKTFTYSLIFGKHPDADVQLECGPNTHTNTASFVTNDTGTTGSDDWTVNANVACAQGCTLTPGYWKTHSLHGPAPYDDAWLAIGPAGADTLFFWSFQSYYAVLWTAPQGNAYYILAHAYIAAKLNILNGASTTLEVDAAITYAENFFSTHVPWLPLSKSARNTAINNAQILDNYNNGLIGPGHCSQ
jgi:hypothetical protein